MPAGTRPLPATPSSSPSGDTAGIGASSRGSQPAIAPFSNTSSASGTLSRIEVVLDTELAVQIPQVAPQRVDVDVDAVLGDLSEDLVVRGRAGKPPVSIEVRATERRQDGEVCFGHATTLAGMLAQF